MIALQVESLMDYLKSHKLESKYFEATKQIALIIHEEDKDFPVFLQVDPTGKILQILTIMPCTMRPRAPTEMARLLHLLNKEIDLPGFGMDENASLVFYRNVFITGHGKIDMVILDNFFKSLPNICKVFFNPIASVANGVYFEAIQSDVRAFLQKLSSQVK